MRKVFLFILVIGFFGACIGHASKKDKYSLNKSKGAKQKKVETAALLKLDSATYYIKQGGTRAVGTIYEFKFRASEDGIQFLHVWFGQGYPVPIDVYDLETNLAPLSTKDKNILIRANKNLYKNFYPDVDSAQAEYKKAPPVDLKGEAVLTYKRNGQEYYYIIQKDEISSSPRRVYR
jgi:hypothetical protein